MGVMLLEIFMQRLGLHVAQASLARKITAIYPASPIPQRESPMTLAGGHERRIIGGGRSYPKP